MPFRGCWCNRCYQQSGPCEWPCSAGLQCLLEGNAAMKRPSPIYFLLKSEQERVEFLAAGVDLPRGKMMEGGEFIRFEIAEDDPRWDSFARVSPRASGPCTAVPSWVVLCDLEADKLAQS